MASARAAKQRIKESLILYLGLLQVTSRIEAIRLDHTATRMED
jgi:hypothetical protein